MRPTTPKQSRSRSLTDEQSKSPPEETMKRGHSATRGRCSNTPRPVPNLWIRIRSFSRPRGHCHFLGETSGGGSTPVAPSGLNTQVTIETAIHMNAPNELPKDRGLLRSATACVVLFADSARQLVPTSSTAHPVRPVPRQPFSANRERLMRPLANIFGVNLRFRLVL